VKNNHKNHVEELSEKYGIEYKKVDLMLLTLHLISSDIERKRLTDQTDAIKKIVKSFIYADQSTVYSPIVQMDVGNLKMVYPIEKVSFKFTDGTTESITHGLLIEEIRKTVERMQPHIPKVEKLKSGAPPKSELAKLKEIVIEVMAKESDKKKQRLFAANFLVDAGYLLNEIDWLECGDGYKDHNEYLKTNIKNILR
jgi:hypothetical protein